MLNIGPAAAMSDMQVITCDCGKHAAPPLGIGEAMGSFLGLERVKMLQVGHSSAMSDVMA